MRQRIELTSAVSATVLGVVIGSVLLSSLHSSTMLGIGGMLGQTPAAAEHELGVAALLVLGLALGAYLHVVFRLLPGLVLLLVASAGLVVAAVYEVVGGGAILAIWPFLSLPDASALAAGIALTVALAVISSGAAIPRPAQAGRAVSVQKTQEPA